MTIAELVTDRLRLVPPSAAARALTLRLHGQDAGRHHFPDSVERTIYLLKRPDGTYPDAPEL